MRAVLLALLPLLALGCAKSQDEDEAVPAKVAFEGKVDPKLVGTWRDASGNVDMALRADGSAGFKAKAMTPDGMRTSDTKGRWLASGDRFLTQTDGSDGSPLTVDYRFRLAQDSLTLARGRAKDKIVYRRVTGGASDQR